MTTQTFDTPLFVDTGINTIKAPGPNGTEIEIKYRRAKMSDIEVAEKGLSSGNKINQYKASRALLERCLISIDGRAIEEGDSASARMLDEIAPDNFVKLLILVNGGNNSNALKDAVNL